MTDVDPFAEVPPKALDYLEDDLRRELAATIRDHAVGKDDEALRKVAEVLDPLPPRRPERGDRVIIPNRGHCGRDYVLLVTAVGINYFLAVTTPDGQKWDAVEHQWDIDRIESWVD